MSTLTFSRVAVFGATGATGREIVRELRRRGLAVRAVSRSNEKLARDFGDLDVERHAGDLGDPSAAAKAAEGCDLIFDCVGLPMERFADHIVIARNTAQAAQAQGARAVLVTSYWSYGPGDETPMREDRPLAPGSDKAAIRKQQEDVMLEARACVARLPDFYGPGAEIAIMNDALQSVRAGKAALWPGDPEAPRDFLFIPDSGRLVCDLAMRDEAYGRAWNVPGSGAEPPRAILEQAARQRGVDLKVRRGRSWMLWLAGIFNSDARAFRDVLPLYERPAILDTEAIRQLLDEIRVTPYEEGLRRTLE
ncbi:MAG: NAD(P)H-binding protein [Gemmatimonadales bacterium]|jgi:nucleoside-diphosphate-sugar epimerase